MQDKIYFDHLGYARCHNLWIGKRHYEDGTTIFYLLRGDHPHDPDGDSESVAGPHVHTLEEAVEWAKQTRIKDILNELDEIRKLPSLTNR